MPEPAASLDPRARDTFVRRARHAGRLIGVVAAGASAALSVVAAHAFKGHDGRHARTVTAAARARTRPAPRNTSVPPPEHVPAISGAPAPLETPAAPPAAADPAASAPVEAAPPPETSGGS